MKIPRTDIMEILQTYYSKKNSIHQKKDESKKADNITLSSEGHLFKSTLEKLKEEPEIRQEMVDDLKEKIHNGEYHIEGMAIAPHMVHLLLSQDDEG